MNYTKTVICLANSRKPAGRCVAGKEFDSDGIGPWMRPVSSRPGQEVSEEERRFTDGTDPKVLDIVEIPMIAPVPHAHQAENHLIDPNAHWVKQGHFSAERIAELLDTPGALWTNNSSSYYGLHDRLSASDAAGFNGSLYLIQPEDLELIVGVEGVEFGNGRRRVRARFSYRGTRHSMLVTDPPTEREFFSRKDGRYDLEAAAICVSLTEAFQDGNCYKVVATVFDQDRV